MAQNNVDDSGFWSNDDTMPIRRNLFESPHFGNQSLISAESSLQQVEDKKTDYISSSAENSPHLQLENKETDYISRSNTFSIKFLGRFKSCQTYGRETVKDMLIGGIPQTKQKNTDSMILKVISNGCAINLGKPTDLLQGDVEYECIFRSKKEGKSAEYANIRQYNVKKFEKSWNMGHFYIKFDRSRSSQPSGDINKVVEMVQIDFFPEESLYQALYLDGRLRIRKGEITVIKWWCLKLDDVEVPIGNSANSYKGKIFKLYTKPHPDETLPDYIEPLFEPSTCSLPGTSSQSAVLSSNISNHSVAPLNSKLSNNSESETKDDSACSESPKVIKICSDKDCEDFFKATYKFEFKKQEKTSAEEKRISNIKKCFEKHDQFALQRGSAKEVRKMKDFMALTDSVGAVVVELESGEEHFMGTCFVIGAKCVITNRHVIDQIKKKVGFKDFYIDFNYGEEGGHKFRFLHEPVVSSPVDFQLDYAILKLHDYHNDGMELPPSLSKCGYAIPTYDLYLDAGQWIALVGHPGGRKKLMEDSCPLENPRNLDRDVVLALRRESPNKYAVLHDTRRQTYDTSTFFHGSSGSPGVMVNEKLLVLLHCRGFYLQDNNNSIIEQGVRMSAVRDDVEYKINSGVLKEVKLSDFFDKFSSKLKEEPMDIDSN